MENAIKQSVSNSESSGPPHQLTVNSESTSGNHEPSARSPEDSPVSSISSHQSSLTHGSSPREQDAPSSPAADPPMNQQASVSVLNRFVKEEPKRVTVTKTGPGCKNESVEENRGGSQPRPRQSLTILRRATREKMVKQAALGFRVFGSVFCLVSLSVMAADRNQGWALDSFYRYKEFRYCMSVSVIGFAYSAAQALDLAYHFVTGKCVLLHPRRYYFDFAVDQIISYLLISASSTAATRIDDWQSNWGKDKFPNMASASVSMSFLAFAALAFSSIISGYALCNFKST